MKRSKTIENLRKIREKSAQTFERGKDYSSIKHEKESFYLPHVPTFEYLATILTEKGEYDNAIGVCKQALAFGLHNRTKTGYEGRIQRIIRKKGK